MLFTLHAPSIEDLVSVAERHEVMSAKTTYVQPKPRTGIFLSQVHVGRGRGVGRTCPGASRVRWLRSCGASRVRWWEAAAPAEVSQPGHILGQGDQVFETLPQRLRHLDQSEHLHHRQ